MPVTQETIGARLKEARLNLHMSQEQAADAVGLDRTALVKIEKGTRGITSMELVKLASLYRRDVAELLSDEPLVEDPFTVVGRVIDNLPPEMGGEVNKAIELLKEAVHLEQMLGDRARPVPPAYAVPAPTDFEEAIDQGREVANLERRRLGLGRSAIPDVAEVIASQGIWAAAVPLPNDTMGLFLAHAKYGLATFINQDNRKARRRFSYAHEYAHALFDRDQKPEASSRANSHTLREKRANAFASEFLMPEEGVFEALERRNKGGASRVSSWIYNFFADSAEGDGNEYDHEELKVDSDARKIGFTDVVFLAREFLVSYEMAAIRLKDVGVIKKPLLDELLERKPDAWKLMSLLKLEPCETAAKSETDEFDQPYLVRQVMELAFDAYRREKITRSRFISACVKANQKPDEMLAIAEAV